MQVLEEKSLPLLTFLQLIVFNAFFKIRRACFRQPWKYDQKEIWTLKYFSYTDLNVSQKPN